MYTDYVNTVKRYKAVVTCNYKTIPEVDISNLNNEDFFLRNKKKIKNQYNSDFVTLRKNKCQTNHTCEKMKERNLIDEKIVDKLLMEICSKCIPKSYVSLTSEVLPLRERIILLERAEEMGIVERKIWPLFLKESSLKTKLSRSEILCNSIELGEKSYILALLINQRASNRSSSYLGLGGPLSFLVDTKLISFDVPTTKSTSHSIDNVDDDELLCIKARAFQLLVKYMFSFTFSSMALSVETEMVKFLTKILSNMDSNLPMIRNIFLQILTIGLWKEMPVRYRYLYLKKHHMFRKLWELYCRKYNSNDNPSDNGYIRLENYIPKLGNLVLNTLIDIELIDKEKDLIYMEHVESLKEENNEEKGIVIFSGKMQNQIQQEYDFECPKMLAIFHFIHSSLQFFIDLLSITFTRRYIRPYLLSINFSVKCTLCSFYQTSSIKSLVWKTRSHLFVQLVNTLQDLETFGVHDITAEPLSTSKIANLYYERATILQKLVHRHYPSEFKELIYAGVSMVCDRNFLKKYLDRIVDLDILVDISHRLRLIDKYHSDIFSSRVDKKKMRLLVTQVILYHHSLRPSELQTLTQLPLYPDEILLWDKYQVPPGNRLLQNVNGLFSLPKLNTQFLTFGDYLLRTFKLMRLESAYSIRGDLVDVIKRMRPAARSGYNDDLDSEEISGASLNHCNYNMEQNKIFKSKTLFRGWARMGLELKNINRGDDPPIKIVRVAAPKLGEHIPSQVLAEIQLDLIHCGSEIRKEWDEISVFDNLFLVAVDATCMNGNSAPYIEHEAYQCHESFHMIKTHDRVPDEEDTTFPQRYGVIAVRGCMVLEVRDEDENLLRDTIEGNHNENGKLSHPKNTRRTLRVALDSAQYAADARGYGSSLGTKVYSILNVVMRRHGRENNFKAVLETIRGLMNGAGSINKSIPTWLQPVLLGYGDPTCATHTSKKMVDFAANTAGVTSLDAALDYGDTFIDEGHLIDSFSKSEIILNDKKIWDGFKISKSKNDGTRKKYRVKITTKFSEEYQDNKKHTRKNNKTVVMVYSYPLPTNVKGNSVKFTSAQINAIRSGLLPGLTMIVGPPGTGKTDVAVQIISNLFNSFHTQCTVLVTHSNAALNDLFVKVMERGDIDERYVLRLGTGQSDLQTNSDYDFTKIGRVNHLLSRRLALLEQVQLISESLVVSGSDERGIDGSPSYTCETAKYFYFHHVEKRIKKFTSQVVKYGIKNCENVSSIFPFTKYFQLDKINSNISYQEAKKKFLILDEIFNELAEYRPLELLSSQRQRTDYLLTKHARIVAMTCTHAAIIRSHLLELGFHYDNIVFEEAGQMLDIETFIPLLLQRGESDDSPSSASRLKRITLIGDHNQLPPIVKNISFSNYSNLDQSLFTRLIRLGVPTIHLNKQGRARPEIANLYTWRYQDLGNLPHVLSLPKFKLANTGFAHTFQIINVGDFQGQGETSPTAYFYQNLGEAEYAIAMFQYMVLIGYPPDRISILTTYNGQKSLLVDILHRRCGEGTPLAGVIPGCISTVDQYQGQQNDFIILSLVRTKFIGYLRDIRRLIVAVSRSRLGLYIFCRQSLFNNCHDLHNVMVQFASKPNKLELVIGEHFPTERNVFSNVHSIQKVVSDDVTILGSIVHELQQKLIGTSQSEIT